MQMGIRVRTSGWKPSQPAATPAPSVPSPAPIDPNELANATYGKRMPLFAGGLARIGGSIVFGPYISNGTASFGISFGVPANVAGTRALFEIAFDSKVAWESTAGTTNIAAGTFKAETFTARFYQGTLTQSVDALETAQFGSAAIAYRPQMMIFFQSLPLAQFGNKIPYVAAVIGDTTDGADPTDGINLGTAIERVAHSPWAGYTSSTFETDGITDVVQALITSDNVSIVELCRNISRIYRNLDLLQTDKLRLINHGATVDPDLVLTTDHVVSDINITRQEPSSLPRELELITIDPDADYTPVPSLAQRPRDPVAVSSSVGRENFTLPLVMNAATRQAMVTYALYADENARKKISGTLMARGFEVEPGDFIGFSALADGLDDEVFKIIETTHGANFTVDFTGEAILSCAISALPPGDGLTLTGAFSFSRKLLSAYEGDFYSTSGGKISAWHDQSGAGRDLSQGTADRRPTAGTGAPNNVTCGVFNSTDITYLDSAANLLTEFLSATGNGYMIISFIGTTIDANQANVWLNEGLVVDTGGYLGLLLKTGDAIHVYNDDGSPQSTSTAVTEGTAYVAEWWLDGVTLYCRINGSTEVTTPSGDTDANISGSELRVGANFFPTFGSALDGKIFELMTFNAVPTLAERDALVASFKSHIGIA